MTGRNNNLPACKGGPLWICFVLFLLSVAGGAARAPQSQSQIDEINTEFHFLNDQDTLLIHEEEGTLKGQIDAYQGDDESDSVLSYLITIGSRHGDHLEFKTSQIHRKYFRFSGDVERGSGRREKDADFLRLVGDLQIITVHGDNGKESAERRHVILKSLSASELADQ